MRRVVTRMLIGVLPLASGCMMTGGMGGMSRMRSPSTAVHAGSVIGEARTSSALITLEFPAVAAGQNATLMVKVLDTMGAPIPDALVTVRLRRDDGYTTAVAVVAADSNPGVYEAAHRFAIAGVYTAEAEVLIDERNPSSALGVTVRQEVLPAEMNDSGRRSRFLPMALLGAAAMAAMMVTMIAF